MGCGLLLFAFSLATASGSVNQKQQVLQTHEDCSYPQLNFSSASPLIFHSTYSLLQQWPNTFFSAGHTVAPCTIPKQTNLYHAHENGSFPDSPEWFAFDASMAYSILGGHSNSHLLTFRTTRDVKCLYFDGTSAALMDPGSMDAQMLVLHNNSDSIPNDPIFRPPRRLPRNGTYPYPPGYGYGGPPRGFNPLQAEYDRATGLCKFIRERNLGGPGWGYEGVVRMNAAFELIWCNFTSPSAELVSWLNVSAPLVEGQPSRWDVDALDDGGDAPAKPPRRGRPGGPVSNGPFRGRSAYEWFLAAARTYGFAGGQLGRGEARVRIESCGMLSFYDPVLLDQTRARSKSERATLNLTSEGYWIAPENASDRQSALKALGRRRRFQRATNVSVSDGERIQPELEQRMRDVLDPEATRCSGVDWVLMAQTIVADYSSDLYELREILSSSPPQNNVTQLRTWLANIRGLAHNFYMPFYEYPTFDRENLETAFSLSYPNSLAALDRCTTQHGNFSQHSQLNPSESLTFTSITSVLSGICSTLLPIFLSLESLWLTTFNNISHPPPLTPSLLQTLNSTLIPALHSLEELMAWLGWEEQWTTCNPPCSQDQVCAIPIWPVMGIGHFSGPDGGFGGFEPDTGEGGWLETRCVDFEHGWGWRFGEG